MDYAEEVEKEDVVPGMREGVRGDEEEHDMLLPLLRDDKVESAESSHAVGDDAGTESVAVSEGGSRRCPVCSAVLGTTAKRRIYCCSICRLEAKYPGRRAIRRGLRTRGKGRDNPQALARATKKHNFKAALRAQNQEDIARVREAAEKLYGDRYPELVTRMVTAVPIRRKLRKGVLFNPAKDNPGFKPLPAISPLASIGVEEDEFDAAVKMFKERMEKLSND